MMKTLSNQALKVIDEYLHFRFGSAITSIPYYNNKKSKVRASLRVLIGKGSVQDINDELRSITLKNHIDTNSLADESLKKLLVDNNIGIDCSGFAYYIFDAETKSRNLGALNKNIHYIFDRGILGKIRSKIRPVEHCNVSTLAHEKNAKNIEVKDVKPGDMITMFGESNEADRNHILIIHEVDYSQDKPIKIYYSHSIAYPEDGLYGTGIKQGSIEITKLSGSILEQNWLIEKTSASQNHIMARALRSKTELKRLISLA